MWARLALWAVTALLVVAQDSNVTQCISTYNWSFNSQGQSPCLVAAYLESACGTPTRIDSIPNGTHYTGPTFAQTNECLCSSVTYSLVSACGGCQGRSFSNWTAWTVNCRESFLTTFSKDIPSGTDVPRWAFFDVSQSGDNFNPVIAAQLAGVNIPSSAFSTEAGPTAAAPTAATSSSSSPTTTNPPASASAKSGSSTNSGAIAGGVVGGLVFLALVLLVLLRWYMRRQRNAIQKDLVFDQGLFSGSSHNHSGYHNPETKPYSSTTFNNSPNPVPVNSSQYGTSDASAYPGSPMASGVYTHLPGSTVHDGRRSVESLTPSMQQFGIAGGVSHTTPLQPNRGFRGAAEVA